MNSPRTNPLIIRLDSPWSTLLLVGGKGASLARLSQAGLPVPAGFHLTTEAYRLFVLENNLAEAIVSGASLIEAGDQASLDRASAQIHSLFGEGKVPDEIGEQLQEWYQALGGSETRVAVRSSATAEDLPEMSFAGQQETFLNVCGDKPLLEAVKACWASLWTPRALSYRLRQGISNDQVAMAVVVQELVPADAAGILFTAHPVTGERNKIVINAAWGLGEAIVSGQVTPDTYVVVKDTMALETQEVADKEVMTAPKAGGTRQVPVPSRKRKKPALSAAQAAELARLGLHIEELYGQPMDIEWALAKGQFYILQARPITALPEPPVVLDWKTPRPKGSYWRASVVELLPDPLSPLFATLGLPAWNRAMHSLGKTAGITREDLFPEQILLTINDYAYYDYGFSAAQSFRLLRAFPTLIRRLLPTAQKRWQEEARPRYAAAVEAWDGRDLKSTLATQLLDGAREVVELAAQHYLSFQSGILPLAGTSEAVFTFVYNRFVRRSGDPTALTFLLGYDSLPIIAEESLYDIAVWVRAQLELAAYLQSSSGAQIAAALLSDSVPIDDAASWQEFSRRFSKHQQRFGHTIYDLDFAKHVPADDPAPLLETLKHLLEGTAQNPYQRQAAAAAERAEAEEALFRRLKGWRKNWIMRLVRWVQRFLPMREDGLGDVGLGWPLVRRMLLEIGRRLAAARAITGPEEVFWLRLDELEGACQALDSGRDPGDFHQLIEERRSTWEHRRQAAPPVVLPVKGGGRFMGINWTGWMPAKAEQTQAGVLHGIGASPGQVTGVARVVHGSDEFGQVQPGDILVAKITTPAWTPLFALASGVVTDVGGPLSHSSIVAREYHIPAVLGTGLATKRIQSGQVITVDGDAGVVRMGK